MRDRIFKVWHPVLPLESEEGKPLKHILGSIPFFLSFFYDPNCDTNGVALPCAPTATVSQNSILMSQSITGHQD